MLTKIANKAVEYGVNYSIKVVDKCKRKSILTYTDYQPYTEILKQDMQTNCILEILQTGQKTNSLRFQEAVGLGKKLLTNNEMVKYEKYYNPKYVQIFKTPEDIDWDFVKDKIDVDYGYEGEYSPIVFLNKIENVVENGIL